MRNQEKCILNKYKAAPPDGRVIGLTILKVLWGFVFFTASVTALVFWLGRDNKNLLFWFLLVFIVFMCLVGFIRLMAVLTIPSSYAVTDSELIVRSTLGELKIFPLRRFNSIEDATGKFKPASQASNSSIEDQAGNMGGFGYRGVYGNTEWVEFEALASSHKNPVILLGKDKLLISPRNPDRFVAEVRPLLQISAKREDAKVGQTSE